MPDFTYYSSDEMTVALNGKVISSIEIPDDMMDDFLIIHFEDKTALILRYNQIYEWKVYRGADGKY